MVIATQAKLPLSRETVFEALHTVSDPEIPTISVVDLGIITKVEVDSLNRTVHVVMTPTFVGCPALSVMKSGIESALQSLDVQGVTVDVDFSVPWSSNLLTEQGRVALHKHGLALPAHFDGEFEPEIVLNATCPFCNSTNTKLVSPFGPTLCRALYVCNTCTQGFEQFKPA